MSKPKIYTAGVMRNKTFECAIGWRLEIQKYICEKADRSIEFIHPPLYFNYLPRGYEKEREVIDWELGRVESCDILVVNLNDIELDADVHFEIAYALSLNRNTTKNIKIIGFGETDNLSSWIKCSCLKILPDLETAAEYIVDYLM